MSGFGGGFGNSPPGGGFGGGGFGQAPAFGSSPPAPATGGGFPSSPFGGGGGFGNSANGSAGTSFAAPASFGAPPSGGFGAPSSGFGTPNTNTSFGAPSPGFGQPGFGTNNNNSGFGSPFGSSSQQNQSQPMDVPNPFGSAPAAAAVSFGMSSNVVMNNNNNNNNLAPSGGGMSFAAPASSGFGNTNNNAPAPSFGSSPFGSATAPSSSPFGGGGSSGGMTFAPPASAHHHRSNSVEMGGSDSPTPMSSPFGNPFGGTTNNSASLSPIPEDNMGDVFGSANNNNGDNNMGVSASQPKANSDGGENEKLAKLKAKLEAKKKKLAEKQKKKDAAAGDGTQQSGSDQQPNDRDTRRNRSRSPSPTPPGGDTDQQARAARNAARFAQSTNAATQAHMPSDLRGKSDKPKPSVTSAVGGDANREDLANAKSLVGTCTFMCPDEELLRRERENDIQLLEIPDPGGIHPPNWTLRNTAVKRFRRSAADYKLDVPEWVRPPDVLESVCSYLEEWVMERDRQGPDRRFPSNGTPNSMDVYQFIWDRTRMIRKDFILQNYVGTGGACDARAVRCHERIARWHAMCEHQLSHINDFAVMQSQQNIQELGQAMKTLNQYYDDSMGRAVVEVPDEAGRETRKNIGDFSHGCSSDACQGGNPIDYDGSPLNNTADLSALPSQRLIGKSMVNSPSRGTAEPEMRGLYILLTMNNDGGMEVMRYSAVLFKERPEIYNSKPVQLALDIFKAKKEYNYVRFFRFLKDPNTPYLFSCLMFKHIESMRKVAFRIMCKTYGAKKNGEPIYDAYPLKRLAHVLCFEDMDEARAACKHYNITVKEVKVRSSSGQTGMTEVVFWRHSDFKEPRDPDKGTVLPLRPKKMLRYIESKLKGATRLGVCRGEVSGQGASLGQLPAERTPRPAPATPGRTNLPVSQPAVAAVPSPDEPVPSQAPAAAPSPSQDDLLKRQQEILRKQKEEAEDKAREEELLRRRLEEERQQAEQLRLAQKEKERLEHQKRKKEAEELLRRQEEAKKKEEERKRREEEMRIQERKLREEKERQERVAREAARLKEEEERRRKEEERLEKLRLEEVRRQREIQAEKERQRQLELERIRKEEERKRLEALKAQEEERKRKEEIARQEAALGLRVDKARKLLLLRRLRQRLPRQFLSRARTLESVERIDPTFFLSSPFSGDGIERELIAPRGRSPSGPVPQVVDFRRILNRILSKETLPLDVASVMLKVLSKDGDLMEMARSKKFRTKESRPSTLTFLFKVAVILPDPEGFEEQSMYESIHTWLNRRLEYGRPDSVQQEDPDGKLTVEVRVLFVKADSWSGPPSCDAALVVIPPSFCSGDWSNSRKVDAISAAFNWNQAIPRVAFVMGESFDADYYATVNRFLAACIPTDSEEFPVVFPNKISEPALEGSLMSSLRSLISAFTAEYPPLIEQVSVLKMASKCISDTLWRNPTSDCLESAVASLSELEKDLTQAGQNLADNWSSWPADDFAGEGGLIRNYFGEGLHLPTSWTSTVFQDVGKTQIQSLRESLLRGSVSEAVSYLLVKAPSDIQDECDEMMERRQYRKCLQRALEFAGSEDETTIYLPKGDAQDIVNESIDRVLKEAGHLSNERNDAEDADVEEESSYSGAMGFVETTGEATDDEGVFARARNIFAISRTISPVPSPRRAGALSPPPPPGVSSGTKRSWVGMANDDDEETNGINSPLRSPPNGYSRSISGSATKRLRDASYASAPSQSRDEIESAAFTRKLQALLNGEATVDMDVGKTTLARLVRNTPLLDGRATILGKDTEGELV